ncbi:MAG: 8-amino-7-oxononanoate synthase [Beijerinckiaceae bacterium]|nr:8-amino-7-oxononanoate synthase [Beijerinckiaceae bacterium]
MQSRYEQALEALNRRGRLRALAGRSGLDFTSNDYLGLAESPELKGAVADALARGVPVGAGGSRLLRGNHAEHEMLEEEAARFFGGDSALFFGSGFAANAALISTLPQRGDLLLYDALVHASTREGLHGTRAAHREFAHNDVGQVESQLRAFRAVHAQARCFIAVESLYSMDGDLAPLTELASLAARYDAVLLIDEAHATGVLGPQGRGLSADMEGAPNVITLHTCGKALGASGALLLMPELLRRYMINRCKPFIYATAPSPLVAAAVRVALRMCAQADDRRAALRARISQLGDQLTRLGRPPSGTQIQPVVLGADRRASAVAEALAAEGFDIRAIRPPTVPEGTARLRITLSSQLAPESVDALGASLGRHLQDLKA